MPVQALGWLGLGEGEGEGGTSPSSKVGQQPGPSVRAQGTRPAGHSWREEGGGGIIRSGWCQTEATWGPPGDHGHTVPEA